MRPTPTASAALSWIPLLVLAPLFALAGLAGCAPSPAGNGTEASSDSKEMAKALPEIRYYVVSDG